MRNFHSFQMSVGQPSWRGAGGSFFSGCKRPPVSTRWLITKIVPKVRGWTNGSLWHMNGHSIHQAWLRLAIFDYQYCRTCIDHTSNLPGRRKSYIIAVGYGWDWIQWCHGQIFVFQFGRGGLVTWKPFSFFFFLGGFSVATALAAHLRTVCWLSWLSFGGSCETGTDEEADPLPHFP